MKYVTGYTGFSGDPELQEGHYLAMKATVTEGATTTVELLGGYSGPVTLDSDMNFVLRIVDKDTQSVKLTATLNGASFSKVYSLRELVLEEEAAG